MKNIDDKGGHFRDRIDGRFGRRGRLNQTLSANVQCCIRSPLSVH